MANYTKREQNRADLILGLEAGLRPPRSPMPTCACGVPAKWASGQKGATVYFCNEHLPADLRGTIESIPLHADRDLFA
jgi:hypothetical protein